MRFAALNFRKALDLAWIFHGRKDDDRAVQVGPAPSPSPPRLRGAEATSPRSNSLRGSSVVCVIRLVASAAQARAAAEHFVGGISNAKAFRACTARDAAARRYVFSGVPTIP